MKLRHNGQIMLTFAPNIPEKGAFLKEDVKCLYVDSILFFSLFPSPFNFLKLSRNTYFYKWHVRDWKIA